MTPSEFKAWFEGFTEAMEGRPNGEQWEKIKKRVAEIDGKTVTEKVFIDRYWPPRRPWSYWEYQPHWGYLQAYATSGNNHQQQFQNATFNSMAAMKTLGASEYLAEPDQRFDT